ncbi:complex I NDUFA9 subunit family protein [Devosia sp. FJ2-5-3]|uniref:complex I NDUFA9 subunit family protein n=1 Tax=Devosia sp. FJ2-5-3 TaxID=2976680 RepID=UPI0023D889E7|nr:complex I NDUFA9 subunit family protein [Devosia sp. FJ2-5-3]WEJ58837.1 complex I NDUFA9 subunit family protein [Devosia sp. FJ2-5-3]
MDRFSPKLVTVFGGSGFVGTSVVQLLAARGYRIRVAVRRPDLAGPATMLGTVGQIVPIQANLRNAASVERAVAGADMVVNLVGLGIESGKQKFASVNTEGAATVARAAKAAGVKSLVHMSALGADTAAKVSAYARTKLEGENAVLAAFPEAIILRPSLIFGQGDGFFNLMGTLARMFPIMPLISGTSRFQPVYVGDVAEAIVKALDGTVQTGRVYELGGPEVETHQQLLERILREAGRKRPLLPLSNGIAGMFASILSFLPFKPLITSDQVALLGKDNVVSEAAISENRTLAAFGITPTSMDTILPSYMWRFRKHGQFDRDKVVA